ncbi:hypothetical protein BDR26DRAFT_853902 [Obelidium mucronatum]|nr:hypothetical protein BDR26DRAFT_853902 [Obelidium mucronatum]
MATSPPPIKAAELLLLLPVTLFPPRDPESGPWLPGMAGTFPFALGSTGSTGGCPGTSTTTGGAAVVAGASVPFPGSAVVFGAVTTSAGGISETTGEKAVAKLLAHLSEVDGQRLMKAIMNSFEAVAGGGPLQVTLAHAFPVKPLGHGVAAVAGAVVEHRTPWDDWNDTTMVLSVGKTPSKYQLVRYRVLVTAPPRGA